MCHGLAGVLAENAPSASRGSVWILSDGLRSRRRLRRFGARLATDPVALALEVVDVAVVHEPVDERGGERAVVEQPAPLGHTLVRRDDRRFLLVAGGDHLVEDRADLRVGGQVPEFVQDQEVALDVGAQDLRPAIEAAGAQDPGEERVRGGEADEVAALEEREPDADRQVRLAEPGGPDQDEGAALRDETVVEVPQHDLAVELGAEPEVEFVERLLEGEGRIIEPAADLIVLAGQELLLEQATQEVRVRHLLGRRAVEPLLMDLADASELELREHLMHQPALPGWTNAS